MSRHPGDDVEAVHAGDDETDTHDPCDIDRLVEGDDADSRDGDDPECGPRSVDDSDRQILQREREQVKRGTVPDEDAQTRKWT